MSDISGQSQGKGKRKRKPSESGERTASSTIKSACAACRQRKIRCNALRPTCSYCASREQVCVYRPAFKRAQCSQSHVDALEAKVRKLENSPHAVLAPAQQPLPQVLEDIENNSIQTQRDKTLDSIGGGGYDPTKDDSSNLPSSPRVPDTRRRYGRSSTLHFALNVKASTTAMADGNRSSSLGRRISSLVNEDEDDLGDQSASPEISDVDDEEQAVIVPNSRPLSSVSQLLPHRHLAKILFEKYFEVVHPIWPFLLEGESRDLFNKTWTCDEPPQALWIVQLNLIMSLGCQHCEGGSDNETLSEIDVSASGKDLYRRAQVYVYTNAFNGSSIGMLQALLLMTLYQQAATLFNEFYLTIGHASRMAQSLGLHVSRPESVSLAPQNRELHRRLWWGCFCLDRISSMLYGRPMGIPYGHFSEYQDGLPLQVDDQYLMENQKQPSNIASIYSFFHHTVRLYHVMDDVLLRLRNAKAMAYHESQNTSGAIRIQRPISDVNAMISLLNTTLQLDGHLLSWHEHLPTHLQFHLQDNVPSQEYSSWLQRQKDLLRGRFLAMRILLHRQTILFLLQPQERRSWPQNGIQEWPPLFSDCSNDTSIGGSTLFRQQGTPSTVETTLTHLSASICVSSAIMQIQAIDHQISTGFTGEWWWSFNFTFNALCVLCGAMALHRRDLEAVMPDLPRARDTVRRGLSNMRHIGSSRDVKVRQSARFLQKLTGAALRRHAKEKSPVPVNDQSQVPQITLAEGQHIRTIDQGHLGVPDGVALGNESNRTYNSLADMPYEPSVQQLDWNMDMKDFLSSWGTYDGDNVEGSRAGDFVGGSESSDNVQTLFHNSFDIWGALDDSTNGGGTIQGVRRR